MFYKLEDNSIFIADSHFSKEKNDLKNLLELLDNETIKCESIIFLGDIFDFLSSQTTYFINVNQS